MYKYTQNAIYMSCYVTTTDYYLRQGDNEVVYVGLSCSVCDLSHGYLSPVVSVRDVLGDATVEQDGLLGHEADLRAQPRQVVVSQRSAVQALNTTVRAVSGDWSCVASSYSYNGLTYIL